MSHPLVVGQVGGAWFVCFLMVFIFSFLGHIKNGVLFGR